MDELDIARIRAYAAMPAMMPATRYKGRKQPMKMNNEILRLTLENGAEGLACCDSGGELRKGVTLFATLVRSARAFSDKTFIIAPV